MTHTTTKQTVLITGVNNPEGIGAAIAKSLYNSWSSPQKSGPLTC